MTLDLSRHLPPYRSLLNPGAQYDYSTHTLVPVQTPLLPPAPPPSARKIKMKYKLLLSDVLRRRLKLSLRLLLLVAPMSAPPAPPPPTFVLLPTELLLWVVELVDDRHSHLALMQTCRLMYRLTKPRLYREVCPLLTYRLAQLVTQLRLDPNLGVMVERLDLSRLEANEEPDTLEPVTRVELNPRFPGGWAIDVESLEEDRPPPGLKAGWRDWKFRGNPLYDHVVPLAKTMSHQVSTGRLSVSSALTHRLRRMWRALSHGSSSDLPLVELARPSMRRRLSLPPPPPPRTRAKSVLFSMPLDPHWVRSSPLVHPRLGQYAYCRDLPVGYVLHLLEACPRLRVLSLGGTVISHDYLVTEPALFASCDSIHASAREAAGTIAKLMFQSLDELAATAAGLSLPTSDAYSLRSGRLGMSAFLLLKLVQALERLAQAYYTWDKRPAERVFLLDLNLKTINPEHLEMALVHALVDAIAERAGTLERLCLDLLVWINTGVLQRMFADRGERWPRLLWVLFVNAGMSKQLSWAKVWSGRRLWGFLDSPRRSVAPRVVAVGLQY